MPIGLLHPFKQLRYLNISGNSLNNTALEVIDPCRELEVSHSQKSPGLGNNLAWNATHICPEIYCPASWTVGCLILSGQFVEYITVKHCGSTAAGVTPAPRYHYCNWGWRKRYLQFSLAFAVSVYTFLTTDQSRGFISFSSQRDSRSSGPFVCVSPRFLYVPHVSQPLFYIPYIRCISPKLVSLHSSCGLFSVPCWGSFVATVLPSNLLLLLPLTMANLLGSNKSRSSSNSTINQNGNNNHFIAIKPFILIEFNCVYTSLKPFGSCYCGWAKITKLFCLVLRVFYTIKNMGLLKLSY